MQYMMHGREYHCSVYSLPYIMHCICCYYVLHLQNNDIPFHTSCIAFAVIMYYTYRTMIFPSIHHVLHLLLLCTTPTEQWYSLPYIMYCICCYYVLHRQNNDIPFHTSCIAFAVIMYYTYRTMIFPFHTSCIAFAVTMYYTDRKMIFPSIHHALHLLLLCTTPTEQWYSLPYIMYCICCYYVLHLQNNDIPFHTSCIAFAVIMYYTYRTMIFPSIHHVLHLLLLCTAPTEQWYSLPYIMHCICCYYVLHLQNNDIPFHTSCIAFAVIMYCTYRTMIFPFSSSVTKGKL